MRSAHERAERSLEKERRGLFRADRGPCLVDCDCVLDGGGRFSLAQDCGDDPLPLSPSISVKATGNYTARNNGSVPIAVPIAVSVEEEVVIKVKVAVRFTFFITFQRRMQEEEEGRRRDGELDPKYFEQVSVAVDYESKEFSFNKSASIIAPFKIAAASPFEVASSSSSASSVPMNILNKMAEVERTMWVESIEPLTKKVVEDMLAEVVKVAAGRKIERFVCSPSVAFGFIPLSAMVCAFFKCDERTKHALRSFDAKKAFSKLVDGKEASFSSFRHRIVQTVEVSKSIDFECASNVFDVIEHTDFVCVSSHSSAAISMSSMRNVIYDFAISRIPKKRISWFFSLRHFGPEMLLSVIHGSEDRHVYSDPRCEVIVLSEVASRRNLPRKPFERRLDMQRLSLWRKEVRFNQLKEKAGNVPLTRPSNASSRSVLSQVLGSGEESMLAEDVLIAALSVDVEHLASKFRAEAESSTDEESPAVHWIFNEAAIACTKRVVCGVLFAYDSENANEFCVSVRPLEEGESEDELERNVRFILASEEDMRGVGHRIESVNQLGRKASVQELRDFFWIRATNYILSFKDARRSDRFLSSLGCALGILEDHRKTMLPSFKNASELLRRLTVDDEALFQHFADSLCAAHACLSSTHAIARMYMVSGDEDEESLKISPRLYCNGPIISQSLSVRGARLLIASKSKSPFAKGSVLGPVKGASIFGSVEKNAEDESTDAIVLKAVCGKVSIIRIEDVETLRRSFDPRPELREKLTRKIEESKEAYRLGRRLVPPLDAVDETSLVVKRTPFLLPLQDKFECSMRATGDWFVEEWERVELVVQW